MVKAARDLSVKFADMLLNNIRGSYKYGFH